MYRLIFLICFPLTLIFAQQKALEKELENCDNDICRAALYQRLAKSYIPLKDYDKICYYFEKELVLRRNIPETEQLAIEKSKNYFNLISLLKQTGNYDRAEKIALESISFNRKLFGENSSETADAFKQYAQICILQKLPQPTKLALEKALKIRKKEKNADEAKIIELLILQSGALDESGDPEMAESVLLEALSLYKQSKLNDEQLFARLHLSLGALVSYRGRITEAISYTKKSLEIRLKFGKKQVQVANCYGNLGVFYHKLKQYNNAVIQLEESVNILTELLGENNPATIESKSNLAAAYIELGKYEEAKKVLAASLSLKRRESYFFALWQLAEIETKKSNHVKAIFYYNAVESELLKIYGPNHPKLAELYLDFGNYYIKLNEPVKAMDKLEKSLKSNKIYNRVSDPVIYLEAAGNLLKIKDSIDDNFIKACFDQIGKIWNNCRRDADYKVAIENIRNFYESLLLNIHLNKGIDLPAQLLINCFETVKSLMLLSALNETDQLKKARVPIDLINKFKDLKNETIYYEQQWMNAEFSSDKNSATRLRKLFEASDSKFAKLKNELQSQYKSLFNFNTDFKYFAKLRNNVTEQELVLHYFMGESNSFVLAFNSTKIFFKKIDADLINLVRTFSTTLQNFESLYENQKHSFMELTEATFSLSKALLPEKSLLNFIQKITIIPDAALFYIPFEVLYYEAPDFNNLNFADHPFLLRNYAIRYAYSLNVLSKQKSKNKTLSLTGIAPLYDSKIDDMQELRTNAELTNLSKVYSGNYYKNRKILKSDILEIFAQSPALLHLAMHAAAPDSSGAYFVLSDKERVEMFEISGFNLDNTALIVLSACETGLGVHSKGEGLISLGRAFAYSGAASVMNTLWPLHDHSAVELMRLFYANLDKGMTKSEALRRAKLDFLSNAGGMQAHPVFWAAPVLWGNDEPVRLKKKSGFLVFVLSAVFVFTLIFTIFLIRKRLRIKKSFKLL